MSHSDEVFPAYRSAKNTVEDDSVILANASNLTGRLDVPEIDVVHVVGMVPWLSLRLRKYTDETFKEVVTVVGHRQSGESLEFRVRMIDHWAATQQTHQDVSEVAIEIF